MFEMWDNLDKQVKSAIGLGVWFVGVCFVLAALGWMGFVGILMAGLGTAAWIDGTE